MARRHRVLIAQLKMVLADIIAADKYQNYDIRNENTYKALGLAAELKYPCGFRIDKEEPEWPVAYIELPTGQVSWHTPQHVNAWDGHTTEQKNERITRYIEEC